MTLSQLSDMFEVRLAATVMGLLVLAVVTLFIQLQRAQSAHLRTAILVVPVAEKLARMVALLEERSSRRAIRRKSGEYPVVPEGGKTDGD